MSYDFGPDAYRDNEEERLHTYAYEERLNGGDGIEDFEREELEQIISLAKHEGASPAMVDFAKRAKDHLDNEDEREGTKALERVFDNYWGDMDGNREESYRQDMNDAGRGHLLP